MKLFVAILCSVLSLSSWAEDTVLERATCDDIQAQIAELSALDADENITQEIADLKSEYRRNCTRSAGARRTSADTRLYTIAENVDSDVSQVETETIAKNTEDVVEYVEVTDDVQQPEAESVESKLTPEQALANLDAGLCADGSQPNKFGCCGGEIFKDLGNTMFGCCDEGGECFPPIK